MHRVLRTNYFSSSKASSQKSSHPSSDPLEDGPFQLKAPRNVPEAGNWPEWWNWYHICPATGHDQQGNATKPGRCLLRSPQGAANPHRPGFSLSK